MAQTAARVRKPSATRRDEIVRGALRVIGERGVTSLTAATLAGEVGLTSGALFRHFDSMDDILRAAVDCAVERLDATLPEPGLPPRERLHALARARIELLRGEPGLAWMLRSEQAYLVLPADAVERLRAVVARSREALLTSLRDGVRDGSFRQDIAPRDLLVPVMGTIHALTGGAGIHRESTATARRNAGRALAALIRMLEPPSTPESRTG
ncbi:MAG: TetR/AcrR family transcriptional regulator [Gemmatimonadota bacterium]